MSTPPDFDELVGTDVAGAERERLRRAHDLLLRAGPPAELDPWLVNPPAPWSPTVRGREARDRSSGRWRTALLAAALALSAFVVGTFVGGGRDGFDAARVVNLHGTKAAPRALGAISIGRRDDGGNWPMLLRVEGLGEQPAEGYYTLALLEDGRPTTPCGTFRVHENVTVVRLNAPYELRRFTGWVVTEFRPGGSHRLEAQRIVLRG